MTLASASLHTLAQTPGGAEAPNQKRGDRMVKGMQRCAVLSVSLIAVGFAVVIAMAVLPFMLVERSLPRYEWSLGHVTHNSAVVWAWSQDYDVFRVRYWPHERATKNIEPKISEWVRFGKSELERARIIKLTGLDANCVYEYDVEFRSGMRNAFREKGGHVRTMMAPKEDLRFGFWFGSCINAHPLLSMRPLSYIATAAHTPSHPMGRSPLAFGMLLGDVVYSDLPYRRPFQRVYRETVSDSAFQHLFRNMPLYSMLDDHEVWNDYDRGPSNRFFINAIEYFNMFFGQRNPPSPPAQVRPYREGLLKKSTVSGYVGYVWLQVDAFIERFFSFTSMMTGSIPSVLSLRPASHPKELIRTETFYSFDAGSGCSFFVLDTRQYAAPFLAEDTPSKSKLGTAQKDALKRWLVSSRAKFKFLVSPVAWASSAAKIVNDGWVSYSNERAEIFDFIYEHNVTGVVLLSGDVHWASIVKHRPYLYEIAASPVFSFPLAPLPWWQYFASKTTEETIFWSAGRLHYGHVEYLPADQGNADARINATIYGYLYGSPRPVGTFILSESMLVPKPTSVNSKPSSFT